MINLSLISYVKPLAWLIPAITFLLCGIFKEELKMSDYAGAVLIFLLLSIPIAIALHATLTKLEHNVLTRSEDKSRAKG